MRRILVTVLITVLTAAWLVPFAAMAQQHSQTKYEFEQYHVVLAKKGPRWKSQATDEGMEARMQIIEGIQKLAEAGVLASAGLVNDGSDVEFILILKLETYGEVLDLLNKSPNVRNGMYTPVIYSWFAPKGLAPAPPSRN